MKRLGSSNKIQGILQLQQHPTTREPGISNPGQSRQAKLNCTRLGQINSVQLISDGIMKNSEKITALDNLAVTGSC
jgi:hypothetical protein